jgi:C4-dicarboxylate-specific signal transduction histidine kinase
MERYTDDAMELATDTIIRSLDLPVLLFAETGLLTSCNAPAERLLQSISLGYSSHSINQSLHLNDLCHYFLNNLVVSQEKTATSGTPDNKPTEFYAPESGQRFSLKWSTIHSRGKPCTLLLMIDLTERDQVRFHHQTLYEALFQTSRALSVGEMATVLAHELNQPLGAIVNYLSAARRRLTNLSEPENSRHENLHKVRQAIDLAASQAEQASAVINRIREFVHTSKPCKAPCHAHLLIGRVVTLLQLEIQHHQVSIHVHIEPGLPELLVDAIMVELVLVNLVKNAVEAVSLVPVAERKVNINVQEKAVGQLKFTVADSGQGIHPEHSRQLFTPFFTTKRHGMGAGLAICRSIVEYHSGQLYVEEPSVAPSSGQQSTGTRFICILPTVLL